MGARSMGKYIGCIKIKNNNSFFNFKPIAKIEGNNVIQLTEKDLEDLLPKSNNGDIMLSHTYQEKDEMFKRFPDGSLAVFDFTVNDLQDSLNAYGNRNPTGYKVSALALVDSGKIRTLASENIFQLLHEDKLSSDFYNDQVVDINTHNIPEGEEVLISFYPDGFLAGPYVVGYREAYKTSAPSSYYIKPSISENKYTVSGYTTDHVIKITISDPNFNNDQWLLAIPRVAEKDQLDVIDDDTLIEGFKAILHDIKTIEGSVKIEDIPGLLDSYKESVLSGSILTDDIKKARLDRLSDILTSEENVDETLSMISDCFCDLIVRYKDRPNVETWLQTIFKDNPDLLDNLKDIQVISSRINQLKQQLSDMVEERDLLAREIEEKKNASNNIAQEAISAETDKLRAELDALQKSLGLFEDISELKKIQENYINDIKYLEEHQKRLTDNTEKLELQFQNLITNYHDKIVNIAFDGFISNKILSAAAEWETEQNNRADKELFDAINKLDVAAKSPEALVDYLCRTVKAVRPSYSKNAILNIAICLTQGFLTVFSGDPGCGKTSICNIFGQILGCDKISGLIGEKFESSVSPSRYIPVSVERGWTSKRDLVGYYNPLSKVFDKSNRRIYDALYQLDYEKKSGLCTLPYIILLDEANLSPMEYYWADFMNICDDLGPQSTINLGEDYIFAIPETLHFLATINNDHTTETLSPRLIDRAWVISLPKHNPFLKGTELEKEALEVVSWQSLKNAFIPSEEECVLPGYINDTYEKVAAKMKERLFFISPRNDKAIKKYWAAASQYFEPDDTKTDGEIIALDYAVSQRILPKIEGSGSDFEKWLEDLRSLFRSTGLNMSAEKLTDIIKKGNLQMKYYRFFS